MKTAIFEECGAVRKVTYNFVRQSHGRCAFARITLSVEPALLQEIMLSLPDEAARDLRQSFPTDPEWTAGAVEGVEATLRFLFDTTGLLYKVQLLDVLGSNVDTNGSVTKYVASLAVLSCVYGRELNELPWGTPW